MDSITQAALGAAIGEATLGARVGRKAALWGAALGTVPDLDVLATPFLDDYAKLAVHRGFSHSIFFAILAGAISAWALQRLYQKYGQSFLRWFSFTFLALFTHALLDGFTVYGTQLLNPISNYPFAWNSVFIIDPLYTIWLLIALLFAMFYRKEPWRMRVVAASLLLSTGYLIWGQFAKYTVDRAFLADLSARGIQPEQFMSNPTVLNTVLWMGIARQGDTLFVGLHGLADGDGPIQWLEIPRNSHYIQSAISQGNPYVERLLWFCRGYYYISEDASGNLWLHDLRFGRSDGFLTDRGNFIFRFELLRSADRITGFKQVPPVMRGRMETLNLLWRRIQGDTSIRGGFRMGLDADDLNREL